MKRFLSSMFHGFVAFIQGTATSLKTLLLFASAFAISFVFPPATLIVYALAAVIGIAMGFKSSLNTYNLDKTIKKLDIQDTVQQKQIKNLNAEIEELRERYNFDLQALQALDHRLVALKQFSWLLSAIKAKANTFIKTSERTAFVGLVSQHCQAQISQAETILAKADISASDYHTLETINKNLVDFLKNNVSAQEKTTYLANHQFPNEKKVAELNSPIPTQEKAIKSPLPNPYTMKKSVMAGVKSTISTFAIGMCIATAIAAVLVPPAALLSVVGLGTMVGVSAAILAVSAGVGALTGISNRLYVQPREKKINELRINSEVNQHRINDLLENKHDLTNVVQTPEQWMETQTQKLPVRQKKLAQITKQFKQEMFEEKSVSAKTEPTTPMVENREEKKLGVKAALNLLKPKGIAYPEKLELKQDGVQKQLDKELATMTEADKQAVLDFIRSRKNEEEEPSIHFSKGRGG